MRANSATVHNLLYITAQLFAKLLGDPEFNVLNRRHFEKTPLVEIKFNVIPSPGAFRAVLYPSIIRDLVEQYFADSRRSLQTALYAEKSCVSSGSLQKCYLRSQKIPERPWVTGAHAEESCEPSTHKHRMEYSWMQFCLLEQQKGRKGPIRNCICTSHFRLPLKLILIAFVLLNVGTEMAPRSISSVSILFLNSTSDS